jgi:hypothetical protein
VGARACRGPLGFWFGPGRGCFLLSGCRCCVCFVCLCGFFVLCGFWVFGSCFLCVFVV